MEEVYFLFRYGLSRLSLARSLVGFTFHRKGNFRWEEIKRNAGFLSPYQPRLLDGDDAESLARTPIPPNNSRTFNFLLRPKIVSGGRELGKSCGGGGGSVGEPPPRAAATSQFGANFVASAAAVAQVKIRRNCKKKQLYHVVVTRKVGIRQNVLSSCPSRAHGLSLQVQMLQMRIA